MIEVTGDLWTYKTPDGKDPDVRVITTNGTVKQNGECVMGRGCALEAKKRWPRLAKLLGNLIRTNGNRTFLLERSSDGQLYSFPVKHHWHEKADIDLIVKSAKELVRLVDSQSYLLPYGARVIVLPRPGCGNGKLDWETEVKPVLEKILDDRFHVITFDKE